MAVSPLWVVYLNIGYVSFILGLATHSHFLRKYFWLPFSFLCFCRVAFFEAYVQDTTVNRLRASVSSLNAALHTLEFLCIRDPQAELVRVSDTRKEVRIENQSYTERLRWALALCMTQRGVGWNWRVSGVPRTISPTSKTKFVWGWIFCWAANTLVLEILSIIFLRVGSRTTLIPPLVPLHAVIVFSSLQSVYALGCIVWVLAGFGRMDECAPLFGNWRDASTLKGFWGRAWHQSFKRPVVVIPTRILQILGLSLDSIGIGPFLMTGIYHALTVHAMTSGRIFPIRTFLFFALQPLGFLIERYILRFDTPNYIYIPPAVKAPKGDVIDHASGNATPKLPHDATAPLIPSKSRLTIWLGYAWVLTYLIFTSRLYFSDMVDSGFYEDPKREGWIAVKVLRRFIE